MKNNAEKIRALMDEYNRSFYIYDEEIIERQIDTLLEKFPEFEFLYSVKTNPFAPVVNFVASKGFGADAASSEEVIIGERAGLPYEKILYSTPGKTRYDIERTIEKAIIIADSYNELILINKVAEEKNLNIKVGLRINMDFNMFTGGGGSSSKFGVDEQTLLENKEFLNGFSNIKIAGIHVHLQSQVLDYEKLYRYYERVFKLAFFCKDELNFEMEFINFGGGLGVPYSLENDQPLDIDRLSEKCNVLVKEFKEKTNARLIIESGRFVICEAGQYVSPVVDIKESMGTKYVFVEKGLNGFLRPAMAEIIKAYRPGEENIPSAEPFFTVEDAFEFNILTEETESEKVTIAGSLCTALDILAKDIVLPKARLGDAVVVSKAGSYAYSLSSLYFASHPLPLQLYVRKDGEVLSK